MFQVKVRFWKMRYRIQLGRGASNLKSDNTFFTKSTVANNFYFMKKTSILHHNKVYLVTKTHYRIQSGPWLADRSKKKLLNPDSGAEQFFIT